MQNFIKLFNIGNKITFLRKKIIVSVISDLVTDQRVIKECKTLLSLNYEVVLIGRHSENDFGLKDRGYMVVRFKNIFRRGPAMYLCFNIQLFFYLLFQRVDVLWANDLDCLLPNYLISNLKSVKLIYDSHEYFTMSVIKLSSRKIWNKLEAYIFPRLKNVITVNNSIKKVYEDKYHVPITVIRNVPYLSKEAINFDIDPNKKILIIQGVGINENRGAEEAVEMMRFLPERFLLYFIGRGTVIPYLKKRVKELHLEKQIIFIDPLPYEEMMAYTRKSFLGLILEKIDVTDEHMFALPNRFFDYIKACIPILSTAAIEVKNLIEKYQIGMIAEYLSPEYLAECVLNIEKNIDQYRQYKNNTVVAASDLCWEKEEEVLKEFVGKIK